VVESDVDGRLQADLLPGRYRVVARSLAREDEALAIASWEVGGGAPCCNHVLEIGSRVDLQGKVLTPDEQPAVEGSLLASPQLPPVSSYLTTALGLAPVLPREASGLVDLEGRVSLGTDPGLFDLSLRPPTASLFPWGSRPGVQVGPGASLELGELRLAYPVVLRGKLRDGLGRPLAGALLRAWIPHTSGESPSSLFVLPAGEVRTDAEGKYRLLLPPELGL
jgi:hypothetical protein